jgi:hypothetical protein
MKLELTMHTLICGRGRKNIKLIESATGTAIYFPPPFPRIFGYTPPGAQRRPEDQIFITGENTESILRAKQRLHDLVMSTKVFVKPIMVTDTKLDAILLERLDKVRKIIENNGSYILLPPLGMQRGVVRVQGTDVLHVERTVRELMALVSCSDRICWRLCLLVLGWPILQRVVVHNLSRPCTAAAHFRRRSGHALRYLHQLGRGDQFRTVQLPYLWI